MAVYRNKLPQKVHSSTATVILLNVRKMGLTLVGCGQKRFEEGELGCGEFRLDATSAIIPIAGARAKSDTLAVIVDRKRLEMRESAEARILLLGGGGGRR